ncbi:MAG: hypothetical protein ACWA44_04525 [Thiotrichales bacterium]
MKKICLSLIFAAFVLGTLSSCDQSDFRSLNPQSPPHYIPPALTEMQPDNRLVTALCPNGGMVLVHGLDHDGNGHLSPYEQLQSEVVCNIQPGSTDQETGVALTNQPTADNQL